MRHLGFYVNIGEVDGITPEAETLLGLLEGRFGFSEVWGRSVLGDSRLDVALRASLIGRPEFEAYVALAGYLPGPTAPQVEEFSSDGTPYLCVRLPLIEDDEDSYEETDLRLFNPNEREDV